MLKHTKSIHPLLHPLFSALMLLCALQSRAQLAADTAYEKTVCWQITGNGLTDTSYLFGTMHPVFREDVHIPRNMAAALLRAKIIYLEHELYDNNDSLYLEINAMEKPVLKRMIGGLCFSLLEKKLKEYNDTILHHPVLLRLNPSYLGGRLISDVFGNALTSTDAILLAIALGNGQQVAYLDTPDMMKKMANIFPSDVQATQLYHFLAQFELIINDYIKNVKAFTQLYYSGDIGKIYTRSGYFLLNDGTSGMHLLENAYSTQLLDDRNKKWLPVITAAIRQQPAFFAVGAAHLAGRKGLINLLRKKGFTVLPVQPEY